MKKKNLMKMLSGLALTVVGCVTPTFFLSCDDTEYRLEDTSFNHTLAYNSQLSLGELSIIREVDGKEETIEITPDMIVSENLTDTVGQKELVIKYGDEIFTVSISVKYRVEFKVCGEVIDTQYVLSEDEIEMPLNPYVEGYNFIEWRATSDKLDNNVVYDAYFKVSDQRIPKLQTYTATFGDKLSSITLPSNKYGAWKFVDDINTSVGNAGENTFTVEFEPTDPSVATETKRISIKVNKKELTFENIVDEFSYDGQIKTPSYTLAHNVANVEMTKYYSGDAVNAGIYIYELDIVDDNYTGYYYGEMKINKVSANIFVDDVVIDFGDSLTQNFAFTVLDNEENELDNSLVELLGLTIESPAYLHAGTYELNVNYTNNNFNVVIHKGYLTVNKVELDFEETPPTFVGGQKIIYGNTLSSVVFENIDVRGKWHWEDSSIKVVTPTSFTAKAIFIPDEDKDYLPSEKDIVLTVLKKKLTINILDQSFTYNGNSHTLDYSVSGLEGEDQVEITGNITKIIAGEYPVELKVLEDDLRYYGSAESKLVINKASNSDFTTEYSAIWTPTLQLKDIALLSCYEWVDESTSVENVGEQKFFARYTPVDTINYLIEEKLLTVNVAKADCNITTPENYVFDYNPLGYTLNNIVVPHTEDTLAFTYYKNGTKVDKIDTVGNYRVVVSLNATTHYNSTSKGFDVTINKCPNVDTVVTTIDATYGDTLNKFPLPVSTLGVWSWADENVVVGNHGVNSHLMIFTPNDTENYMTREVKVTFNVAKKVVSTPSIGDATFNNNNQIAVVAESSLYTVIENKGGNDAGSYPVVLELTDSNNYCWAKDNADSTITLTFSIIKNTTNIWTAAPAIGSWTYGENSKTATASATYGDVVVMYKLKEANDSEYSLEVPTKASDYVAKFSVADTPSFNGLEDIIVDFNIAYITVEIPTITDKEYNGEEQSADITENDFYTVEVNTAVKNAGTYSVQIKLKDDSFKWTDSYALTKEIPFVIHKSVNRDNITLTYSATYGDKLGSLTLFDSPTGSWKWVEGNDAFVGEFGVNTHAIEFVPTDKDNYATRVENVTINVAKKKVQVPVIAGTTFNNEHQIANVSDTNEYYVFENIGGKAKGVYPVTLRLNDSNNYCWAADVDGCDITLDFVIAQNINNKWLDTPSIDGWKYKETPNNWIAECTYGDIVVTYKRKGSDDEYSLEVPTKAGTYYAKFTVEETDDYNGLTHTVEFDIEYIEVAVPAELASTTYNGENQTAVVPVSEYYSVITNTPVKDAGSYTVVIKLNDESYKWSDSYELTRNLNFVIKPVENTDEVPTLYSAVYGNNTSKFTLPTNANGTWSWNSTNVGNAGENILTATFTPNDTKNYLSRTISVKFNVSKKVATLPTVTPVQYSGVEQTSAISDTTEYTVTQASGTDVGAYPIILTLKDGDNYCWREGENSLTTTVNFTIIQNTENKWETNPTITNWQYTESPKLTLGTSKFGSEEIIYMYKIKGADDSTYSTTIPTTVGEYTIKFTVPTHKNYIGISYEIDFEIEHYILTIPTISSLPYNGNTRIADIVGNDYYSVTTNAGGINVGDYDVVLTITDSNCKWPDSTNATKTLTFAITKATDNDWTQNPVMNNFVYTGSIEEGNKGKAEGKYGDVVITYSVLGENEFTSTLPTIVGSYEAKFEIIGNDNYNGISAVILPFNITKATPTLSGLTISTVVYENANNNGAGIDNSLKASVAGSFSYDLPKLVTNNNAEYSAANFTVTFNPTDSHNYSSATATASINMYTVCYNGSTYYGSIENALDKAVADNNIMVIPNATRNITIASNATIKQNVTLTLPYLLDGVITYNSSAVATLNYNKDTCPIKNFSSQVLTTRVVVKSGVTLTNNGTLFIAGEISGGAGGVGSAGHTARNFAELELEENAHVVSTGIIRLYGYIDDSSSANTSSTVEVTSGNVYMPFIVNDHRGGTYLSTAYMYIPFLKSNRVTPFHQYELRNIVPKFILHYGANLLVNANMYATQQNHAEIKFIGATTDYFLQLTSGARIEAKYNPTSDAENVNNRWAEGVNNIDFYGGAKATSMSLNLAGTNVSTKDVDFPLTWRQKVRLVTGEYTMSNSYKMMPGHEFTIESGASLVIDKVNIYKTYKDEVSIAPVYSDSLSEALFIVRGSLEVKKNIGGAVYSDSVTAKIKAANVSYTTYESASDWKKFKTKSVGLQLSIHYATDLKTALANNTFTSSVTLCTKNYQYTISNNTWV